MAIATSLSDARTSKTCLHSQPREIKWQINWNSKFLTKIKKKYAGTHYLEFRISAVPLCSQKNGNLKFLDKKKDFFSSARQNNWAVRSDLRKENSDYRRGSTFFPAYIFNYTNFVKIMDILSIDKFSVF